MNLTRKLFNIHSFKLNQQIHCAGDSLTCTFTLTHSGEKSVTCTLRVCALLYIYVCRTHFGGLLTKSNRFYIVDQRENKIYLPSVVFIVSVHDARIVHQPNILSIISKLFSHRTPLFYAPKIINISISSFVFVVTRGQLQVFFWKKRFLLSTTAAASYIELISY